MKTNRVAVYAGSFDILTYGHLHMISEGADLFDKLIVAIGVNAGKDPVFDLDERKAMLDACVTDKEMAGPEGMGCLFYEHQVKKITTEVFDKKYLIKFCEEIGASYYLRGLRNSQDFESEMAIVNINHVSFPFCRVKPIWIPPSKRYSHISSSTVKGLIGYQEWESIVYEYVPPPVFDKLLLKYGGSHPYVPEEEEDED